MVALLRDPEGSNGETLSRHARRLEELKEAAAKVRRQHERGELTDEEASNRLRELRHRYRSFIDLFL